MSIKNTKWLVGWLKLYVRSCSYLWRRIQPAGHLTVLRLYLHLLRLKYSFQLKPLLSFLFPHTLQLNLSHPKGTKGQKDPFSGHSTETVQRC